MWKDWKFWAGIVVAIICLGYFFRGISIYGIPANEPVTVQATFDANSFLIEVDGDRLARVQAAPTNSAEEPEKTPLPSAVRWFSRYPGELQEHDLAGTLRLTRLRGGVSAEPPAELLRRLREDESGNLPAQFETLHQLTGADGESPSPDTASLEMETGAGRTLLQSLLVQAGTGQSGYFDIQLAYSHPEGSEGTGFFLGDETGDGVMVVFSADWSAASAHRVQNGVYIGDELGRVSGIVPALQQANYWWLIPATVLLLLSIVFRAYRWRIIFGEYNKVGIPRHFGMIVIGFAGNAVLPLRAGEIIRAWLGSRENQCTFSLSLGTLVMARLFDMIAMLGSLVVVLAVAEFPEVDESLVEKLRAAGWLMMIPLVGIIAFLFLLTYKRELALRLVHRFTFFLPHALRDKFQGMAEAFAEGVATLRSPVKILWCLFHSAGVWFTIAVSEYCIMLAFGLGDEVGLIGSAFVMVVICFAIAAPSTPGYVGLFHAAIKIALINFYGVAANVAMGVAIILHAHQMLTIITAGAISMLLMGVSFKQVQEHAHDAEKVAEGPTTVGG